MNKFALLGIAILFNNNASADALGVVGSQLNILQAQDIYTAVCPGRQYEVVSVSVQDLSKTSATLSTQFRPTRGRAVVNYDIRPGDAYYSKPSYNFHYYPRPNYLYVTKDAGLKGAKPYRVSVNCHTFTQRSTGGIVNPPTAKAVLKLVQNQ